MIKAEQLRARRIIKNTINRLNSALIYSESEEYQRMLQIANEYDINPFTQKNTKNIDSIIDFISENFNINKVLKDLDKIYTKPQLENKLAKKLDIKRTTSQPQLTVEQRQEIKEKIHLRFEYHEFIKNNYQAIYRIEGYSNILKKGKGNGLPTWDELEELRKEVEQKNNRTSENESIVEKAIKKSQIQKNNTIDRIRNKNFPRG